MCGPLPSVQEGGGLPQRGPCAQHLGTRRFCGASGTLGLLRLRALGQTGVDPELFCYKPFPEADAISLMCPFTQAQKVSLQ